MKNIYTSILSWNKYSTVAIDHQIYNWLILVNHEPSNIYNRKLRYGLTADTIILILDMKYNTNHVTYTGRSAIKYTGTSIFFYSFTCRLPSPERVFNRPTFLPQFLAIE